jgi:hypothetical protein
MLRLYQPRTSRHDSDVAGAMSEPGHGRVQNDQVVPD